MELPIVIDVMRPDGTQERVPVGTARRDGAVFVLDLLRVPPDVPRTPPPMASATVEDLESIAARARKTLADPSKIRWHRQESELLHRVERELARLRRHRS